MASWKSSTNVPRYRDDPISYTGNSGTTKKSNSGGIITGGFGTSSVFDKINNKVFSGNSSENGGTGVVEDSSGTGNGGGYTYSTELKKQQEQAAAAAAYQAYLEEIRRRQQEAADAAYNRNVSAMNQAFDQRGELLKGNLDTTLANLQTDYNASRDVINRDATEAAREAYINRVMSQRNLAQNMAAQGLSGGASETTLAGLENNYGNARNQIAATANENLGSLEDLYTKNRNSAMQEYNDQLAADALARAQYMTQFENDRQNMLAQAYDSQLQQLMSLDPSFVAAMSAATNSQAGYTPVNQATPDNTAPVVSTTQGVANVRAPRYALRLAQQMASEGQDANSIIQMLARNSVNTDSINSILSQLGY